MYVLPRVASPESSPKTAFDIEFDHRSVYITRLLANAEPCDLPHFLLLLALIFGAIQSVVAFC